MTIKELIEKLREYPEDTLVLTMYHSDFVCTPDMATITIDSNDNNLWDREPIYNTKAVLIWSD